MTRNYKKAISSKDFQFKSRIERKYGKSRYLKANRDRIGGKEDAEIRRTGEKLFQK